MEEQPSVDAVARALGSLGRVMGGIEVGHLVADPTLLVLVGGAEMRQPSAGRRRLAQRVNTVLASYIRELQPIEDRLTAQVMLATEPGLRDKNVKQRVNEIYDGGKGRLTYDSFNKRRPGVLRRTAEHLIVALAEFDTTAAETDQKPQPFDVATSEILSEMIWHAQELGCYLLAFRVAVVSATHASDDDPEQFFRWQESMSEPGDAARYSFYEYLRVGELVWELQQLSGGRRFLRDYGMEHLLHPALAHERFVPVSFTPWGKDESDVIAAGVLNVGQLKLSVSGPFGSRASFLARLETDAELNHNLSAWNRDVTSNIADADSIKSFARGHALGPSFASGIRDLLFSLAEVGLPSFASVDAMQARIRVLESFVLSGMLSVHIDRLRVRRQPPSDLETHSQRSLWSALTMHRFAESLDWQGSDELPELPNRQEISKAPDA